MRRLCCTAMLLIISAVAASAIHAETKLTVATFNCEFLIRDTIEFKFDLPANSLDDNERTAKFDEGVAAVAKVVKEIGADVIALTEVGPEEDVESLREAVKNEGLDYPYKAVCTSGDSQTKQHVAVLSTLPLDTVERTIPGRESYFRELDDPEEEDDTGVTKGMAVTFDVAGQTIHLYVCHFISERAGYESDAQRIAQASIVRRHYLDVLNRGDHVIVTGDLNARRGSPAVERLRGLDDLYGDLVQTGQASYFEDDEVDQRWTYEFMGLREQIDHILPSWSFKEATARSKGIQARTMEVTQTLSTGGLASDHRPFIVTFRLK